MAGTVLYLPVWVKGAGFKTGDSHLAQGHGEVNLNALEGAYRNITVRLTARKDLKELVDWPMASTPTHWMTMGMHTDLLESTKMAVRKAITFLNKYYGMDPLEAYAFCSMAVDLHVTQVRGLHARHSRHDSENVFRGRPIREEERLAAGVADRENGLPARRTGPSGRFASQTVSAPTCPPAAEAWPHPAEWRNGYLGRPRTTCSRRIGLG
ncbi:MAG: acetamidase/formamidase family protein [Candidatus Moduliflexus flocculans]|nr:acetamidase/formamidase family protein [Candidatus Moduliflexus flocculans]